MLHITRTKWTGLWKCFTSDIASKSSEKNIPYRQFFPKVISFLISVLVNCKTISEMHVQ